MAAHFDAEGVLIEAQSSFWREIEIEVGTYITQEELRDLMLNRIRDIQGFRELSRRLQKQQKDFPLTGPPRLVVYPWKGKFPVVWTSYGYSDYEGQEQPQQEGLRNITFGQIFVNAVTGERILFAPTLKSAEIEDTGSGLAVTPLGGPYTNRTLHIVHVEYATYRLKDTTKARDIITYDVECNMIHAFDFFIWLGIISGTLPVSENQGMDKNWNRLPYNTSAAQRILGQQPEVDAHFFVRQQYEWYDAVAGGRKGWDDDYPSAVVPPQTIHVVAHCHPPMGWGDCSTFNAFCSRVLVNVPDLPSQWICWLSFPDGNRTTYDYPALATETYDYPAGSHFIVAHEYQHAITDFSFMDGDGNPGLTYDGWLGAVNEGLSDVFGALSSEQYLPCKELSYGVFPSVARNIVYPRDTNAYWGAKLDHFDDRNTTTSFYSRGTILAHCAYLMGKGGVHQRSARTPKLIPVYSLGRETKGGKNFPRAARIWYRALTHYFSTHGALTGIPDNDEWTFRRLRNGCVSAAEDIYGSGSAEHRNTILAFYAVGLRPGMGIAPPEYNAIPIPEPYGADVTFLRWGIDWDLSRKYVGLSSPDYCSLDLFINNDGISEWNALVNVIHPTTNEPTQYENNLYCRVRNVGDVTANNVEVEFWYDKLSTVPGSGFDPWETARDKNGDPLKLIVGTLAAGNSNFPDSAQNTPPPSARVKWCIPPLAPGESVNHFCLRARVTCSNDVNIHNNEVLTNIAYLPLQLIYEAPSGASFGIGNPFEEEIAVELEIQAELPEGWEAIIEEDLEDAILKPGEERIVSIEVKMPPSADVRLEPPLDGDLSGQMYGDLAGPFTGSLTEVIMEGQAIRGRFAGMLRHVGAVSGIFNGNIDLDTAEVKGSVVGGHPCSKDNRKVCLGIDACLRPWRRIEVSQWHEHELIGGVSFQIQVPRQKGPCKLELPPTDTEVAVEKPEFLTPPSLDFGMEDTKKVFVITNSGSSDMGWRITSRQPNWIINVDPKGGTISPGATANVSVQVYRRGLNAGQYQHEMSIRYNDENGNILTVPFMITMGVPN
jgi:hypothetical protein